MTDSMTRPQQPQAISAYEQVGALVWNLASMWNGGQAVLDRLVAASGDKQLSPVAALHGLGPEGVNTLFDEPASQAELAAATASLASYLGQETWFDRASRQDAALETFRRSPVAYFCAEYGLASWLPIYSGGLGVLAGDMLKEASDMGLPLVAVGLFYQHGFFHQTLDENGWQTEIYRTLDPAELPLHGVQDAHGNELLVEVPLADRRVYARAWMLEVGRTRLYLLDTDVPDNARPEDRAITSNLYGGDQETRIQQEIVLGIGGVHLLRALGLEPSIYCMNEGHAAFLGLELLADAMQNADFQEALESTRHHIVYTNHTVVPAGNDIFPRDLVERYLGHYADERGIGVGRLLDLAGPPDAGFSMAVLAFNLSGRANAVSEMHARAIPREWPGYAVEVVTNGVHAPSWLGSEMHALLDEFVPDWRSDQPSWDAIKAIPDGALWAAHRRQKAALVDFVNEEQGYATLDGDALTLVWARRFAEYKRAGLLASDLSRLARILSQPERPVQLIISGKAHPNDQGAKRVMQELLQRLRSDAHTAPHVAFVPDYSLRVAGYLTAGADVWVNTPRKPLEASGTSGMKASDNGALQLTVLDGWAAEVDWWDVGWGIEGRDDASDAAQLYGYLEEDVVPCYFSRDEQEIPERWVAAMKRTMVLTLSRYSARRMVLDYVHRLWLPLLREQQAAASANSSKS